MISKLESMNKFSIRNENLKSILYDNSSKIFSIDIFNFKFIGLYRKSTKIGKIIDEIYSLLVDLPVERKDFFVLNLKDWKPIPENKKLKNLNFTNENKFVIGIKFKINIIDDNTNQQKKFEEMYPHKILFREILQKFTLDVGLDNNSFEIDANKNSIPQQIFFEDFGESLFEDILYEYGNAFELRIKKIELKEEEYLVIYFENKISPELELIPFPVLPTMTITDLLPELSKKFDIQPENVNIREKYGVVLSPEEYMIPFKELMEKYGDTLDIIERHFTGGVAPPSPAERIFYAKDISEKRKKGLKQRAAPKAPPPAGPLAKTTVATEREVLEKASEKAPAPPLKLKEEHEEELADFGAAEIEDDLAYIPTLAEELPEIPQLIRYDINMGLQYYSVMMEQCNYLFYIYFSHEELIIEDEEGKTIVKTKFIIETRKKEPPVLDIKVEGEGFEVHPLIAKLRVKKDAINPPVMIFSVLPVKSDKKKRDKKHGETRFLHVLIDFEEKIISHTVLAITVQPKHFHLDLGPIHVDIGKTTATFISIISLAWAVISVIYSLISVDLSSTVFNVVGGFAPSLISIIFLIIFFYTLIKGVYPLKRMWNNALNFDKASPISK